MILLNYVLKANTQDYMNLVFISNQLVVTHYQQMIGYNAFLASETPKDVSLKIQKIQITQILLLRSVRMVMNWTHGKILQIK